MPYKDPEAKKANNRRYYLENRERIMANVKRWQAKNPDLVKGYKNGWFDANPEYRREWYLANREQVLEAQKGAYQRQLEQDAERTRARRRNSSARRRAREREAFVEHVDPLAVWDRDYGVCQICVELADPNDWHLDHIIPIARGGEHSYANVQVTHPPCNWSKAAS